MQYRHFNYIFFTFILSLTLISCSSVSTIDTEQDSAPTDQIDVDAIPDAVPRATQPSRYGNPSSYVVFGKRYHVMPSGKGYKERGIASWYGKKFHGRRTSSGDPYDMHGMTAAHKTLPLPTYVRVTNLKNKRQVILKVNDRGPFHDNRIIDLSHTAAVKLGIKPTGTGWVEVEALYPQSGFKPAAKPMQEIKPEAESVVVVAAKNTAPAKIFKSKPQYALPPTLQGKANLFLQAGAFKDSKNANRLLDDLTKKLSSADIKDKVNIFDTKISGQSISRVRIGPIATVEDAEKISAALVKYGFQKPTIIIE